ncbi:MAG TPA: DUF5668 domain-containing protein [Bryobacteraceae bacterium]
MNSSAGLVRAVRGPLLLIAVGLLFVGDYFGPFPFYKTWPVLLIVYGVLKLAERIFATRGGTEAPAGGSL